MRSALFGLATVALASSAFAKPISDEDDSLYAPLYTPTPPPMDGPLSQLAIQSGRSPADYLIKDSYIVVLKKGLHDRRVRKHKRVVQKLWFQDHQMRLQAESLGLGDLFKGIKHHFDLSEHFKGYSIHVPEALIKLIRALPEVEYVERDSKVWINDPYFTSTTVPVVEGDSVSASSIDIERGAPWGLARISHRDKLRFGTFNVYPYEHAAGAGVDVYVIDTGVNINHVELQGRATWGKTIPDDEDIDANGHGSHCAGTIASRRYGVAKNAAIVAVKVLGSNGSGTMSDVVAGVIWAAETAATKARTEATKKDSKHKGSVANMSLGGGKSPSLDQAVDAAVTSGLHFAVAAGNDNRDACNYSPAAAPKAITVGASTISDERAYFSNHGKCVDIFAPGLNIKSIWNSGPESVNTISGTSMASPHIAGLAAYYLSQGLNLGELGLLEEDDDEFSPAGLAHDLNQYLSWGSVSSQGQLAFGKLREAIGFGAARPHPTGHKPLSTKILKKAMIMLSTEGALADLPGGTVNYLAYTNVTLA
ncbi:subtilisin protease [Melampsora larici-populina 98AG31]|uniref:Subtilisin protease n=1 Tax=Melampsora larici-populina (strain 98AG31 / pathotype 3-4-7) TaxID=747676 RepID=F4RT14_MELLP|nr:subtilisin protease [Melampsora larici-populina 98AG31]EGG04425.1 subtilisin protease [Melampsora larici-populina 98AG31]